jgi:hypothetical protein
LWGPDPLRFGFWFNLASDGFGIILHLAVATGVLRLARGWRRRMKLREGK